MKHTVQKKWLRQSVLAIALLASGILVIACNKKGTPTTTPEPTPAGEVEQWITRADQTLLLNKADKLLPFVSTSNNNPVIEINEATTYQTVDGFGYTLTGSSAYLINLMTAPEKANLLNELFGNSATSIGVSYLRISLGASDLSPTVFSYNDLPAGQTDETLSKFSLAADTVDLVPVLKQILTINPNIKIMASPWSAPAWMKTNNSTIGGSLQEKYHEVYAQYFVKYIQAMKARGINIDAITIQNEPQHGGNNPSMVMNEAQQTAFIKNNLGPAFKSAGITTKIVIWDHNCDNPNYPITVMNDPAAKAFIDGSAFHLYAGDISALNTVKNAHPDKALYFTEQWTGANGSFDGDLKWHMRNVIIGSMRNWSRVALEWNLANDPQFGPRTPGGCTECRGAIMLNGNQVTRNVSYYIIAHASKFIPAGSTRIESFGPGNLAQVAFKTPSGKKVLIVLNDNGYVVNFNIKMNNKLAAAQLPANSVATYVW